MRVEVINTGTELLLGNVVNAHLAFFGRELFALGLRVERQVCVPDGAAISDALTSAFARADIVLVTGGLGPTSDDMTRDLTAALLGLPLMEDASLARGLREWFARRSFAFNQNVLRQALVPAGATVLPNRNGTAPGLYLKTRPELPSPHLFLLPGPPMELHPMFRDAALPILHEILSQAGETVPLHTRTLHLYGVGESHVEETIGAALMDLQGLELGYCARPGEVDVRLIGPPHVVACAESIVTKALGDHVFAFDGDSMESAVVRTLTDRGLTLATAESCTGGFLASRITDVPGASSIFQAGFITYSNREKTARLGVDQDLLNQHGAVSSEVAAAMAEGARDRALAGFALSTTGIAGPTGGTPDKPVGTLWIGLASANGPTETFFHRFVCDRPTFKFRATQAALDQLRLRLQA